MGCGLSISIFPNKENGVTRLKGPSIQNALHRVAFGEARSLLVQNGEKVILLRILQGAVSRWQTLLYISIWSQSIIYAKALLFFEIAG
jgi:hypothetical protein